MSRAAAVCFAFLFCTSALAAPKKPPAKKRPPNLSQADAVCGLKMNGAGIPTKQSVYDCAIRLSKLKQVDPCFALVAINNESNDGVPGELSVGYDENQGNGFSGLCSFPKNAKKPRQCSGQNNDAQNFDGSREDLGLDFQRFSRGLGVMQVTIAKFTKGAPAGSWQAWCKSGVPSISLNGGCFVARDLIDAYTGIAAGVETLRIHGAARGAAVQAVWAGYAGGEKHVHDLETSSNKNEKRNGDAARTSINKRTAQVNTCKASGLKSVLQPPNRCRGDAPLPTTLCLAESAKEKKAGRLGYDCKAPCNPQFRHPIDPANLPR